MCVYIYKPIWLHFFRGSRNKGTEVMEQAQNDVCRDIFDPDRVRVPELNPINNRVRFVLNSNM